MTVIVSILIPSGIILAADSRQVRMTASGQIRIDSDYADKIFPLGSHIAAIVEGQGSYYASHYESPRTIGSILQAAAKSLPKNCAVEQVAEIAYQKVADSLQKHLDITNDPRTIVAFHVGGYDPGGAIGELYRCEYPGGVALERKTSDAGAVWSGQREIIDRLILGYDPRLIDLITHSDGPPGMEEILHKQRPKLQLHINFQTMTLQDAVDLATSLIRTTIELERLSDGIVGKPGHFPTCGGAIEVAGITESDGFFWLQHKQIKVGSM